MTKKERTEFARLGGKALVKKRGAKHMSKISKLRWAKAKAAKKQNG